MKHLIVCLCACCFCLSALPSAADEPEPAALTKAEEERLAKICKVLDDISEGGEASRRYPWMANRLVQEVGQMAQRSPKARKALDRYADDLEGYASNVAVVALSGCEGVDIARRIADYEDIAREQTKEEFEQRDLDFFVDFFVLVGLMGPKAKEAIPFLLKELETQKDTAVQGQIRVVLANMITKRGLWGC